MPAKTVMVAKLTKGFWPKTANIILRNRILIIFLIVGFTIFMALQWQYMRFSSSQTNLLPDDHPVNQEYQDFLSKFGEEGNAVVFAIRDSALFNPINFNRWNKLSKQLAAFPEVEYVLSTDNLQELIKDNEKQEFKMQPLITGELNSQKEIDSITNHLFNDLPFYENLLYNKESKTVRTIVNLDKDIVNTSVRKDFILQDLNTLVKNFEKETNLDVHISGMPYSYWYSQLYFLN